MVRSPYRDLLLFQSPRYYPLRFHEKCVVTAREPQVSRGVPPQDERFWKAEEQAGHDAELMMCLLLVLLLFLLLVLLLLMLLSLLFAWYDCLLQQVIDYVGIVIR